MLARRGHADVPHNFAPTAPAHHPSQANQQPKMPRTNHRNPQTEALLQMLGLDYNLDQQVCLIVCE